MDRADVEYAAIVLAVIVCAGLAVVRSAERASALSVTAGDRASAEVGPDAVAQRIVPRDDRLSVVPVPAQGTPTARREDSVASVQVP